ncbi:MAG: tetratricopeptide repeat protein [Candidatus Eremiobacterota bacterium]
MFLNILPKSPDLFSGRDRELKKIEQIFSSINFFYIEGIAGAGKTSLMLKWANILSERDEYKDRILWLQCKEDVTLDTLLSDICEQIEINEGKHLKEFLIDRSLKNEDKCLYLVDLLNKHRYILFIDDFQYIKRESHKIFIYTIKNYLRNSSIFIISSESLSLSPVEAMDIFRLTIKGLPKEDSILLFTKLLMFHDFETLPDTDTIMKIVERSGGYPLILKTFACLLVSKTSTVEDIIANGYIDKDTENLLFGKIMEETGPEEKNILEFLSLSRISLSSDVIKKITHIDNISEYLLLLEDKMFLEKDISCNYLLQPLLKEYIRKKISEDRKIYLNKILGEIFEHNPELWTEAFYHHITAGDMEKGSKFFQKNMGKLCSLGHYEEFMEKVELLEKTIPLTEDMKIMKANVLSMQGRWEESLVILEGIKNNITDETLKGEVYSSLGGLYLNMGNFRKAIPLYEDALKIFTLFNNPIRITKILNYLAIIYGFTGDIEKASRLAAQSFNIAQKGNNETGMAYSLRAKTIICLEQEFFEEGLAISEECLSLTKKIGSSRLIFWALDNKGRALTGLFRYDEAGECFETNLSTGKEIRDNLMIAFSCLGLGRVFYEKGDLDKAYEYYKESIKNYLIIGNNVGVAMCEYYTGHIFEEKKQISRAIHIFSSVLEKARDISFIKLEIKAEIKLLTTKIRNKEIYPHSRDIVKIRKRIPEYFIRERVEIDIILAEAFLRENKEKEHDLILDEILACSEKACYIYGIARICYIMSNSSRRNEKTKKLLRKKAEEHLEHLAGSEKRDLKLFFAEKDMEHKESFIIKTGKK